MKTLLMLAMLSATPALLAAEPTLPSPATVSTNAPALPEDLAEQAALVQQIGAEAARGFDPEAHAQALRLQMESIAARPADAKAPAPRSTPVASTPLAAPILKPAANDSPTPAAPVPPPRETTVRRAIQKLRSVLDELEAQLNSFRKDQ